MAVSGISWLSWLIIGSGLIQLGVIVWRTAREEWNA